MTPEDLFVGAAHELGLTPVELLERYFRHFARFLQDWSFDDKNSEERALCTEAKLHAQEAARALRLLHLLERGELVMLETELVQKTPPSTPLDAVSVEGGGAEEHSRVSTVANSLPHRRQGQR
jgi:hypothetical protein